MRTQPSNGQHGASRPHVVIIGGGFGGLRAARRLAHVAVDVTLVDRRNHHTFQPLLYQVATAGLQAQDIARPLRTVLRRQANLTVRLGTVTGVDWDACLVRLGNGANLAFDYLVIAAGAITHDFAVPGVNEHAFALKDLDQAGRLRDHLITRFELAAVDPAATDRGALRFVIAGGGPTGVEMAGALVELIEVLGRDYPEVDASRAEVLLVEKQQMLLAGFHPRLQQAACNTLLGRGVDVRLATGVQHVTSSAVGLDTGEELPTSTVIWTAGVRANPLGDQLGVDQTRGGRLVVEEDLRIPGHPEAFAIGDIAAGRDSDGTTLPQTAPVAIQQGKHVARMIRRLLADEDTRPFRYVDKGTMATIGRNAAVAQLGGIRLRGFVAWVAWLAVHLLYLVGFRNRASVLVEWAWSYLTHDRGARAVFTPTAQPDEPTKSVRQAA